MRTEEQIRKAMGPLQSELHRLQDAKRRKEHKALLGKCFKFSNSYGGDRPRWWLYAIVTGSDGLWAKAMTFQVTCEGEIVVKQKDTHTPGLEWKAIPRTEFDSEWRKVKRLVSQLNPK